MQCFMKHLLKRNNKEIAAYYVTNKLNVSHSILFNIIHRQPRTMIQTKAFCFIEVETNKCLMQHCDAVQPKPKDKVLICSFLINPEL